MPNDLLAELAQLDHISGVKQANNDNLALVDGLELYAGNDDILARTLDLGGAGGILVASHIVGAADAPDGRRARAERAAIDAGLQDVYAALGVGPAAMTTKAALNLLGHRVGDAPPPVVEADASEIARDPRRPRRATGCWNRRAPDGRASCASCRSAGSARSART